MNKTVILFEHHGGRLGNQFWNHASILAYCIERGHSYINLTFKDQASIFASAGIGRISDFLLRIVPGRLWNIALSRISKIAYGPQTSLISSGNHIGQDAIVPFYLPPSQNNDPHQTSLLARVENAPSNTIFLSGWLFRNPVGIMEYQRDIIEHFKPRWSIKKHVSTIIGAARSKYTHIVGVHIRRKDYKNYWGGQFFNTDTEVRSILDEYLTRTKYAIADTLFILCSDEELDASVFSGLNIRINDGSIGIDLFTLASCDIIIGSDSTFGAMAAYLGNIPIIFMRKAAIDWSPLNADGYVYHNGSLNIQL